MENKYLKSKLKEYYNESKILNFSLDDFFKWLRTKKQTKKLKKLFEISSVNFDKIYQKFYKDIKEKEKEKEIQKSLETLFKENVDTHIGTLRLNEFYKKFDIDYSNIINRQKHSGRISKFRKNLKSNFDNWLISGKVMKDKLKIQYKKRIPNIDYDQIDGWCYTSNQEWIKEFFEYEIKKHKDLADAYNYFKSKLK